jgi:hypothetical protein
MVQTRVQCNENSTRSYENLSVSKLVKTAINTAITVKLLKSKVTLLNTCEKLKMSHEHNVTFEITQIKMRKRNGADPRNGYGDKMRNGTDLDKMRHFNGFFRLFFYVSVF